MNSAEEKALEHLKQIFLSETNYKQSKIEEELDAIRFRLNNKEAKIDAYYPLITDLLEKKIIDSESEVAKVLSPVLGKALKHQILNSKDEIIDALYPIMGETIRRTVAEGLKDFYQSLNQKIDNALKKGIFAKRFKSKLTGISTTDLLLQESFPFSVTEVFLIHEQSGVLISHVSAKKSSTTDPDLISGMLTAIKNFVGESFKNDNGDQNLYEIQYGESKIILERGRYTYLAFVIEGQEPIDFDEKTHKLSNEIHIKYADKLRNFDGNSEKLNDINDIITPFIEENKSINDQDIKETETESRPILAYLLILLLAIVALFWGGNYYISYLNKTEIEREIENKLADLKGFDISKISWEIDGNNVVLLGSYPDYAAVNNLDSALRTIPNITLKNSIKVSYPYKNHDEIVSEINSLIPSWKFPQIKFELDGDKINLLGSAKSSNEIIDLVNKLAYIKGIRIINNKIKINDSLDLVSNLQLNFANGRIDLNPEQKLKLNQFIERIKLYPKNIKIVGTSDGDNNKINKEIALKRAESVKKYLVKNGVRDSKLSTIGKVTNSRSVRFLL